MIFLAIDTCSTCGSISLMRDDKIIYSHFTDIQITHSERLMPQIEQAFLENKIEAKDLSGVLVANGPGSFTGIRIGLATAKGICVAHNIPLMPFNTLEMNAVNAFGIGNKILSVIDARMNEIYYALYDEDFKEVIAPKNGKLSELIDELNIEKLVLAGEIVVGLEEQLREKGISYKQLQIHQNLSQSMALFSLMKLKNIKPEWDMSMMADLEPYYIRSSVAQIKKQR